MFDNLKNKLLDVFLDMFDPLAIFGLGVFFGIGGLFIQPKLSFFTMGFLYGAYLGFAALPVFDSDKWASKPMICACLGALLSVAAAMLLDWSIAKIFVAAIGGVILGYFAPAWAKYM